MTDTPPDDVIRLWPEGPPTRLEGVGPEIIFSKPVGTARSATMLRNVSEPTLSVFRPERPNGVGVIVCPGGGWRILAMEHEGTDVASWLTAAGYTAFLLKYRVHGTPEAPEDYEAWEQALISGIDMPQRGRKALRGMDEVTPYGIFDAARQAAADDGRRAIAIVRERAAEWGLSADKVGMIGFSAGAFLVTDVALDPRAAPLAFAAPIYGGETRGRQVPEDAPPLFTVVAQDDIVAYRMVERLYSDWTDADRSAEMHIYRRGEHGFGMAKQGMPSDGWINLFRDWLADLGLS
ncbi:dienelactone hydrolase family protein [Rhizobium sp. BK376]|uniref:alpha/beta hydrolase n=1 Tax=Rhizobium sp. BK376 TaxID=2512149 RepID=UPI00105179A1|nr:dienelactone hydrolase family protein [Rhizobium sp. BK376]TCR91046.1 dienelactone hydrolase family protein [Rhizobium sp. BK376]